MSRKLDIGLQAPHTLLGRRRESSRVPLGIKGPGRLLPIGLIHGRSSSHGGKAPAPERRLRIRKTK